MCNEIEVVKALVPIAGALIVYELGKTAYFRQKEYELLTKRYLEEGIDSIAKNVDKSLSIYRHNWERSLVIIKHYQQLGKDIRPDLIESPGFIPPDPALFEIWRDYRLKDIVGDPIFNIAHQSLDAFVRNSFAFFQEDLITLVRTSIHGGKEYKITASRDEAAKVYTDQLKKLNQDAVRYYILLGELQKLAAVIQSERFTFENLKELRHRAEVYQGVANLKKLFPVDEDNLNRNGPTNG